MYAFLHLHVLLRGQLCLQSNFRLQVGNDEPGFLHIILDILDQLLYHFPLKEGVSKFYCFCEPVIVTLCQPNWGLQVITLTHSQGFCPWGIKISLYGTLPPWVIPIYRLQEDCLLKASMSELCKNGSQNIMECIKITDQFQIHWDITCTVSVHSIRNQC